MHPDGAPHEHLDEGTAHAWLDDALPPDERARVEARVAACAECAAVLAEARGLMAGASRIVAALDAVPGGVMPARPAARRRDSRRWILRTAAALVLMAGGAALVTTRSPSERAIDAAPAGAVAGAAAALDTTPAPPAPVPLAAAAPRAESVEARDAAVVDERSAGGSTSASRAEAPRAARTKSMADANASPMAASPLASMVAPLEPASAFGAPGSRGVAGGTARPVRSAPADAPNEAVCYALEIEAAPPGWPTRLELDTAALPSSARRGYVARAAAGVDSAYWAPLPGDSVRVVWYAGGGGADVRLGPAGDAAPGDGARRGVARSVPTASSAAEPRAVVARRVGCPPR